MLVQLELDCNAQGRPHDRESVFVNNDKDVKMHHYLATIEGLE